jgi:hypothetical protein
MNLAMRMFQSYANDATQIFQPKHTLIDEWHDDRDEIGMPVVRAIRTITSRLFRHAPTIMGVFDRELRVKIQAYPTSEGMYWC